MVIFDDIRSAAVRTGLAAIDYETTELSPLEGKLTEVNIAVPGQSWSIPVAEPMSKWLAGVRSLYECGAQVVHWKSFFDQSFHPKYGLPLYGNVHDAKAAFWLLEPQDWAPKGLKDRGELEFGVKAIRYHEVDQRSLRQREQYGKQDAEWTLKLYQLAVPLLKQEGLWDIFINVYPRLTPIAVEMRLTGLKVDRTGLLKLKKEFLQEQDDNLHKIRVYRPGLNPNSPAQVADLLYKELKLKPPHPKFLEKGKAGHESTAADAVKYMVKQHDVAGLLLEHREITKLIGTYIEPLLDQSASDPRGRIHSEFNPIGTDTGRWSSYGTAGEGMNLQNIPAKTDRGKRIKKCFVAEEGNRWSRADYQQMELRVNAQIAHERRMTQAFKDGRDLHQELADAIPCKRADAKAVAFGYAYGMWPKKFAIKYAYPLPEARRFRAGYFRMYPDLQAHHACTEMLVRDDPWARTLGGRKFYLGFLPIEGGERMRKALNTPVQGSVADFINRALVDLAAWRDIYGVPFRFLSQVHDEINLEVPDAYAELVAEMLERIMVESAPLPDVPVEAEVTVGDRWLMK